MMYYHATLTLSPPSAAHLGLSCRWTAGGSCRGRHSTGRSHARSWPHSPPRSWSSCPAGWVSSFHIAGKEEKAQLTNNAKKILLRAIAALRPSHTIQHFTTWSKRLKATKSCTSLLNFPFQLHILASGSGVLLWWKYNVKNTMSPEKLGCVASALSGATFVSPSVNYAEELL